MCGCDFLSAWLHYNITEIIQLVQKRNVSHNICMFTFQDSMRSHARVCVFSCLYQYIFEHLAHACIQKHLLLNICACVCVCVFVVCYVCQGSTKKKQ